MLPATDRIEHVFDCHIDQSELKSYGRNEYCNSCKREVFDLTDLSNSEIREFLNLHHGEVCATFFPDQLSEERNSNSSGLGLVAAGFATLLTLAASDSVKAQCEPVSTEIHAEEKKQGEVVCEQQGVRSLSVSAVTELYTDSEKPVTKLKRKRWFRLGRMRVYKQNKFPYVKIRLRTGHRGRISFSRRPFRGLGISKKKKSED
jgi:hypothetical protein